MKKIICSITAILLAIFIWDCEKKLNSPEDVNDFFPLKVGMKWRYKMVKSDYDNPFPKEFIVEIPRTKTVNDTIYYEIKNYFSPGPSLPDPTYMRVNGSRVFVLVNDKEYLLYSFDFADSSNWHLPLYVNPTDLFNYYVGRIELGPHEANFSWSYIPTLEDSEGYWYEIFQKGVGRTKILSFTQLYGNVDWALLP